MFSHMNLIQPFCFSVCPSVSSFLSLSFFPSLRLSLSLLLPLSPSQSLLPSPLPLSSTLFPGPSSGLARRPQVMDGLQVISVTPDALEYIVSSDHIITIIFGPFLFTVVIIGVIITAVVVV